VTGTNVNTPRYSAPEMLQPDLDNMWGCESDIWALGVLFFEMVSLQIGEEEEGDPLVYGDIEADIPAMYGQDVKDLIN
jgi:serine/threonine protein kinase